MNAATVQRTNVTLHPDRTRVLLRPFLLPDEPRARTICAQVMALPDSDIHTPGALRPRSGRREGLDYLSTALAWAVMAITAGWVRRRSALMA